MDSARELEDEMAKRFRAVGVRTWGRSRVRECSRQGSVRNYRNSKTLKSSISCLDCVVRNPKCPWRKGAGSRY